MEELIDQCKASLHNLFRIPITLNIRGLRYVVSPSTTPFPNWFQSISYITKTTLHRSSGSTMPAPPPLSTPEIFIAKISRIRWEFFNCMKEMKLWESKTIFSLLSSTPRTLIGDEIYLKNCGLPLPPVYQARWQLVYLMGKTDAPTLLPCWIDEQCSQTMPWDFTGGDITRMCAPP